MPIAQDFVFKAIAASGQKCQPSSCNGTLSPQFTEVSMHPPTSTAYFQGHSGEAPQHESLPHGHVAAASNVFDRKNAHLVDSLNDLNDDTTRHLDDMDSFVQDRSIHPLPMFSIELHPILIRPMLHLHLCQIHEMMTLLFPNNTVALESLSNGFGCRCNESGIVQKEESPIAMQRVDGMVERETVVTPKFSQRCFHCCALYLLGWLNVVGYLMGIDMDPMLWKEAMNSVRMN